MRDLSLSSIEAISIRTPPPSPDGKRERHQAPRRYRRGNAGSVRLLALEDQDHLVLEFDVQEGELRGVRIRDRRTGEVTAAYDIESLVARGEGPGLVLERRG